jgi:hypothetical protein
MTDKEKEAFKAGWKAGWRAGYEAGPWPLPEDFTLEGAMRIYEQEEIAEPRKAAE